MISSSKISDTIRRIANRKDKKVNPNIILFDIRGHKMRTINYWEQFLCTGKIEDYLTYRKGKQTGHEEDEGAGEGAGADWRYRDDFKGRTSRGI